jgi:hypothetical protein
MTEKSVCKTRYFSFTRPLPNIKQMKYIYKKDNKATAFIGLT